MNRQKQLVKILGAHFVALMVFAIYLPVAKAEVSEEWSVSYNGAAKGTDAAKEMVIDNAGHVYVTGESYNGINYDYYTIAYDTLGNQLWATTYDGGSQDIVTGIATDALGNVYVTGYSRGASTWEDYATVAYDTSGNELWVARYDGGANRNDRGEAITADASGNVYVTGRVTNWLGLASVTIAYDSAGNELWVASHEGVHGRAITTDDSGKVYISGQAAGLGYNPQKGNFNESDCLTIAYDSLGNELWAARLDEGNYRELVWAMGSDSSGNVYVLGNSEDIDPVTWTRTNVAGVTVAYDSSGNQLWVRRSEGISLGALATTPSGNVFVTGSYDTFDPLGYTSYTTIAYDSLGNQLWGDSGIGRAIATDQEGNVYVAGGAGEVKAYDSLGNKLWEVRSSYTWWNMAIATDNIGNVYVARNYPGPDWSYDYLTTKYSQKVPNNLPVADAGSDQTVECAGLFGASIILNGTGSSDPDGDTLSYTWSGSFGIVTGATPVVTLPSGLHSITLTVDDDKGGIATDSVMISVEDTTPPEITSVTLSGIELVPNLYISDVLFELRASDTGSGVANVAYILDGSQISDPGSYVSAIISTGGYHTINYSAMDNSGNVSAAGSLSFSLFEANASGINGLMDYFLAQGLIDSQMETSLKTQATNGSLDAFINHVEAQDGKKIDPVAAQVLIEAAKYIIGR